MKQLPTSNHALLWRVLGEAIINCSKDHAMIEELGSFREAVSSRLVSLEVGKGGRV